MSKLTRGERFKDARTVFNKNKKQTMDEVFAATGVGKSAIQALEDDNISRSVGYDKVAKLSEHYGVSADYLLGISDVRSPDVSVRSMTDQLGLPEDIVTLILNWKNLPKIAESGCELSDEQKRIIAIADEMYPMQKDRYCTASEDFSMLIMFLFEAIMGRPASILEAFQQARRALVNEGDPSGCNIDEWIASCEFLEKTGFLAIPSDEVGEWYLDKMFRIIRQRMKDDLERLG